VRDDPTPTPRSSTAVDEYVESGKSLQNPLTDSADEARNPH
jgi:hypothetical protein